MGRDGSMIVGNKIIIRRVEKEDLPEIHKWASDFEIKELFDLTIDFSSYQKLISNFNADEKNDNCCDFTIIEKETKNPVGKCSLTDVDYVNRKSLCTLYIGDNESSDKGYGTEAMYLLMKFAFEDLNLNRLGLWVFDFNKRAIKCYKRCGMKVEGIMRDGVYRNGKYHDMYFMGILSQEYYDMIKGGTEECSEANM